MPLLLLPPRYTSDSIALWEAASRLGWSVRRLYGWRFPEEAAAGDVVIYGEIFFAAAVAEQMGVALMEPPLEWLVMLPERFRRRRIGFTSITGLHTIPFPGFVKPADGKSFPPAVYREAGSIPMIDILPPGTPVLWSEPVAWELEIRAFVLDRQVRTLSLYARDGDYTDQQGSDGELAAASEFLAEFLADPLVALPPAVVVDCGIIRGRGWGVVEANPCWSAGIYRCNPEEVLRVIARSCIRSDMLTASDRAWVIERGDDVIGAGSAGP